MKKRHDWYNGRWDIRIVGPDGTVKDELLNLRNGLTDDGECVMLAHTFRGAFSNIATFKLYVSNTALTANTDYATAYGARVTPVTGDPYPMEAARTDGGWPTLTFDEISQSWVISTQEFSITPTASWGPFKTLFFTTNITWSGSTPGGAPSNGDILFSYLTIPTRTVAANDTLKIIGRVNLQGVD